MTQQQEKVCAICGCGLCELLSRDLLSLHSWAQSIQSLMKQVVNCTKWNADRRFLSMFHYSQVPPFPIIQAVCSVAIIAVPLVPVTYAL